jgi:large subunit ribosomal protein L3
MTQIFDPTGQIIPVTVIQAGPCPVLQVKTAARDGYEAVQLGFLDKPRRLASRSARGQVARLDSKRQKQRAAAGVQPVAKANCEPQRFVREFRDGAAGLEIGQQLRVDLFAEIKAVDVTGVTKGRGTAGVMKRHHFAGQRASHGVKKVHRHAGSIGMNTDPHHVFKGHRMAGHLGNVNRTARNLKVVKIDLENNLLLVRGAVPGPNGGYVTVRQTNKL